MTIRTAVLALALVLMWPLCANAAESVPTRGMTMAQVKDRFGPPKRVRAPVGQPPITRWYYPGFTVYFERNLTLDTVMDPSHPGNTASTARNDAAVIAQSPGAPRSRATAPTRRGPDTKTAGDDGRPAPGGGQAPASMPARAHGDPKPADPPPASGSAEPADHSDHAPASSAIRAERRQEEANSQFRFNPQSGRIEIVNDTKATSAATDGRSTQPATNVSARTQGTDTVAPPKSATGTDSVKAAK